MPLTDVTIRNAKATGKTQRLTDSAGLYLEISPAGGKWWRFKYRFEGKEKRLSLGVYPDVGLRDARDKRDEVRRQLTQGIDPLQHRKAAKTARAELSANSFEVVAREWFGKNRHTWAESHSSKIIRRLERDVFPWIGGMPVAEISAPAVLSVLRRIEGRGTLDTAHRAREDCSRVFRYAIATGRSERDPVPDLRGALPPAKGGNFAAITDPSAVSGLLRSIDAFEGTFVVQCALRLAPLLFVRPGELRQAEWANVDLETAEWRFIASKTKTDHLVPLSHQAVKIFRELHPLTGHLRFVFPGGWDHHRAMSEAAVNAALRRMGYDTKTEITGHGFRAMARTILAEELHIKPEVIEHQLAHRVPDALGTAYNRTKFLKERKAMMQQWADYLDQLKGGAAVVSLRTA